MIQTASVVDYPSLAELWESSVRATHHFLPEDYLQEIKALLPSIFSHVRLIKWEVEGTIKGFAGVAGQKLEMLFIDPGAMGKGIGRALTEYCIQNLHVDKVDVNEQNEKAVAFYYKMGFKLIGREETDSLGRPFPLLLMKYS